jgi:ribosomal protein S18 acetylase RimI-like enzyme
MLIRAFESSDEPSLVALWQECGLVRPWNDPHKDIRRKLTVQPELFLVGTVAGQLVSSVMAGYEGHRGWVNYLAVSPAHRRSGFATQLMKRAEVLLEALGCPKLNLQIRSSNAEVMAFYRKIGYAQDDVVGMGKRLIKDD